MSFNPVYILLLMATAAISYVTGILVSKATGKPKQFWNLAGIALIGGILVFFKYSNFIGQNLDQVARALHWNYGLPSLNIVLPIGLSFFTFKAISYIIEVHRGNLKPEKNIIIHALYVMFYPELLAGPIDRPQHLIPQLREDHPFDYAQAADGLKLMAWGFFKKLVVADRLAEYVNLVYNDPTRYHGLPVIIATYFFAVQIYADFSGYTDIARGAAGVMGFRLAENFRRPYFAKTVSEFWTRWHISLSSWFRDYVYLPLQYALFRKFDGRTLKKPDLAAYAVAVLATMSLAGLWHGASWNFVAWGALFGVYMIFSIISQRPRAGLAKALHLSRHPSVQRTIRIIITFHLVLLAWVFFRASDLAAAMTVLSSMMSVETHRLGVNLTGAVPLIYSFLSVLALLIIDLVQRRASVRTVVARLPAPVRWGLYYGLVMAILLFGNIYQHQQFLYSRF